MANKPLKEMTIEELRAEANHWRAKIDGSTSWGASVSAAAELLKDCQREIERRKTRDKAQESSASALTTVRGKTHGDWHQQAECARELRAVIEKYGAHLPAFKRESLDMIATKMSRICCGNSFELDHWLDIQGYAHLGME